METAELKESLNDVVVERVFGSVRFELELEARLGWVKPWEDAETVLKVIWESLRVLLRVGKGRRPAGERGKSLPVASEAKNESSLGGRSSRRPIASDDHPINEVKESGSSVRGRMGRKSASLSSSPQRSDVLSRGRFDWAAIREATGPDLELEGMEVE